MRRLAKFAPRLGLAATLAFVAIGGTVQVAEASGCATYGRISLQQQRENEQRSCGFSGPSWSADLRKHVQWCNSVGPDQWKAQLQQRAKMLAERCKR